MKHPSENGEMNVLFTCAGRRVTLLRAFAAAIMELGLTGRLLAADKTAASPAFQVADEGVLVPEVSHPDYLDSLLACVQRHAVRLLIPVTDLDLTLLAAHRERFEQAGCTVMVGSPEAIANCRDKNRTNDLVEQAGLEPSRSFRLDEFLEDPFYPCFAKPTSGSAGIGTGVIEDAEQLNIHIERFGRDLIVQEYLPGQEFTVDIYKARTGEVLAAVPRQRLMVRSGEVERGMTVKDQQLIDAAVKLARQAEGLWGVFCCQCRRVKGGEPRFFEINPRFGGGAPLSIAAGANLPRYLLEEITGRPISAKLGEFTDRLLMLRYDDAVFTPLTDPPETLPGFDTPLFR